MGGVRNAGVMLERIMEEPKIPAGELELYLGTLRSSLEELAGLHDHRVTFVGLPIEEWAGPGYAIGAWFDPYVLTAKLQQTTIVLDGLPEWLASGASAGQGEGVAIAQTRGSQKEMITFRIHAGRMPTYYLPLVWGGVKYQRLEATGEWQTLGWIAELPAVLVRAGVAVFAFNPLQVIHRYLLMAEPTSTRDFTDLIVRTILAASGQDQDLDDQDLRRDFHALGVNALLVCQMHQAMGRAWSVQERLPGLREAAMSYRAGEFAQARQQLARLFKELERQRQELVATPVYIMVMPHGGILFEEEGYAEYDWPEASAKALNLYLDWVDQFGFRFAPDVGASTLEQFAKLYPKTMQRFRRAWEAGTVEFVNGTYAQPYLQLWPRWDQEQQFAVGLRSFEKLFGRRPVVFASQEMALHTGLPALLRKHGYAYAIHRAQNLGTAPCEHAGLMAWSSPGGEVIRTLPAQPLRSEKRGGEIWRHFPILFTSDRNHGVPFLAFTSQMDQSFIDIYTEEILRANRYAAVWGEFVTPSEFFERTKELPAAPRQYRHDDYHYVLDFSGGSSHAYHSGGYSSELAFMLRESARLRKLEAQGKTDEAALRLLLEQEAHDCYIIPYFSPGYFMDGGMTDYFGPRYQCTHDGARGTERFIRMAAGYPERFCDTAGIEAEACLIAGGRLSRRDGGSVLLDEKTGGVAELNGQAVRLGQVKYNGSPLVMQRVEAVGQRLRLSGVLEGFGGLTLEYYIGGEWLYCQLRAQREQAEWQSDRTAWLDCVYLEHAKPRGAVVERNIAGIMEPTTKAVFHSLESLNLCGAGGPLALRHGGNMFFRQDDGTVQNRLWCYGEFATGFWWALRILPEGLKRPRQ